nr:Aldehyde dehydrogenase [Ipomoea batatas]
MKGDNVLPVSSPAMQLTSSAIAHSKKESPGSVVFGRSRYKFWALAAMLMLSFWSILTGTVTLRWSAGNLNTVSHDIDIAIHEDLDVIEMEDRENMVKHIWYVYTNSRRITLPKFWQEAFEAAYEDLISDVSDVREAAISEIAKMSIRYIHAEPPPLRSSALHKSSLTHVERREFEAQWRI